MEIVGLIGLAIVVGVAVMLGVSQKVEEHKERHISPTRTTDLSDYGKDDVGGEWIVSVYRQSGNPYKDDEMFPSKEDAIKKVMSTFKRSGEDSPVITRNIQGLVEFKRWGLVHDEHPNGYNSKIIGTIIISRM
jgi:hypothetical protein